jgi:hypothetical protein
MKKIYIILMVLLFTVNASAHAANSSIIQAFTGESDLFVYNYTVQPGESVVTGFIPSWQNWGGPQITLSLSAASEANIDLDVDGIVSYSSEPDAELFELSSYADLISVVNAVSPVSQFSGAGSAHFIKFKINNTGLKEVVGVIAYSTDITFTSGIVPSHKAEYDPKNITVLKQPFDLAPGASKTFGPIRTRGSLGEVLYANTSATGLTFTAFASHLANGPWAPVAGFFSIPGPGQSVQAVGDVIESGGQRWNKIVVTNPTAANISGTLTMVRNTK